MIIKWKQWHQNFDIIKHNFSFYFPSIYLQIKYVPFLKIEYINSSDHSTFPISRPRRAHSILVGYSERNFGMDRRSFSVFVP